MRTAGLRQGLGFYLGDIGQTAVNTEELAGGIIAGDWFGLMNLFSR